MLGESRAPSSNHCVRLRASAEPVAGAIHLSVNAVDARRQAAGRCGIPAIPKFLFVCPLVSAAHPRHVPNVSPTENLHAASNDHTIAVVRWADDGGAPGLPRRTPKP